MVIDFIGFVENYVIVHGGETMNDLWNKVGKEIVKAAGIAVVTAIGTAIGSLVAEKIKNTKKPKVKVKKK